MNTECKQRFGFIGLLLILITSLACGQMGPSEESAEQSGALESKGTPDAANDDAFVEGAFIDVYPKGGAAEDSSAPADTTTDSQQDEISADDGSETEDPISDSDGTEAPNNDDSDSDDSVNNDSGSDDSTNDESGSDGSTNDESGSDGSTNDESGSDGSTNDESGSDDSANDDNGDDSDTDLADNEDPQQDDPADDQNDSSPDDPAPTDGQIDHSRSRLMVDEYQSSDLIEIHPKKQQSKVRIGRHPDFVPGAYQIFAKWTSNFESRGKRKLAVNIITVIEKIRDKLRGKDHPGERCDYDAESQGDWRSIGVFYLSDKAKIKIKNNRRSVFNVENRLMLVPVIASDVDKPEKFRCLGGQIDGHGLRAWP
jgi:hypothetical protein